MITALRSRYSEAGDVEDFGPFNDAYADAMRDVHTAFPGDLDLSALFAEAIMNRTPWALWDLPSGQPAEGADTLEAIRVLEEAFDTIDGAWQHAGLLHMYIHLMEMSPHPERALRQGDRLVDLVPHAGHLIHMPTHIDVLCGEYENVVSRNHHAIQADKIFVARDGADNFYTLYRCHNYHFKIYGAMFLGQATTALETADELAANLPDDIVRPLADWFEGFVPMKQHVLVRFGRWEDILAQTPARRSGALLRDHGDDALCPQRRLCPTPTASPKRRPNAISSLRRGTRFPKPAWFSTTPAATFWLSRS